MNRHKSIAVTLFVLGACSGSLPLPETTRHARETFVAVPYPPPAALAETVPPPPARSGAVWIDGEWAFHGRSFVWQRGGWVYPPSGARFARWRAVYQRDGRMMLAPGVWYDETGHTLPPPEVAVPATTPANEVTAEAQSGR